MKEGAETRRERETQRDVDEEGKATVCTTVGRRKKKINRKMPTNLPIGKVKFCT